MFGSSRWFILAVSLVIISAASRAQTLDSDANTICNFDPNKQLAVEYRRVDLAARKKALGNSIPYGKVWAPGGKPLTLFANTAFSVGGKDISDGAYTMLIVPGREVLDPYHFEEYRHQRQVRRGRRISRGFRCSSAGSYSRNRPLRLILRTLRPINAIFAWISKRPAPGWSLIGSRCGERCSINQAFQGGFLILGFDRDLERAGSSNQ